MSQATVGADVSAYTARPRRYTTVAIVLHWLIGGAILFMLGLGLAMTQLTLNPATLFGMYQLHKSVGITILLLVAVRVAWRLSHPPPPLPASLPKLERRAAHAAHLALYAFMLAMPLTGWAMVSASVYNIPTVLFGVVPWPHLPVLPTLANKAAVEGALKTVHALIGFTLIAFVALHVAAALRHQLAKHDAVLWRILPLWRQPPSTS